MRKAGLIFVVCGLVAFTYILMMLFQPTINSIIASTNSTVESTVNWTKNSNFALAQAVMIGWPWWSYFIPVSIGMIAVVGILKGD